MAVYKINDVHRSVIMLSSILHRLGLGPYIIYKPRMDFIIKHCKHLDNMYGDLK